MIEDRHHRAASLALTFLFVASAMLVFVTAMPTVKAAGANHYFVQSSNCSNGIGSPTSTGNDWANDDCWSLSSGGATGAGAPTSADDAHFDVAGIGNNGQTVRIVAITATAHDVIVTTQMNFDLQTPNMNPSETAILSIHSFAVSGLDMGAGESVYFGRFGDLGTSTLKYSGTITSSTPNPDCETNGIVGGVCFYGASMAPDNRALYVEYTGPNSFGTASDVSFLDSAAVTKTIYCDPGCVDDGANVNIVFGPRSDNSGGCCGPSPTVAITTSISPATVMTYAGIVALSAFVFFVAGRLAGLRRLWQWSLVVMVVAGVLYATIAFGWLTW